MAVCGRKRFTLGISQPFFRTENVAVTHEPFLYLLNTSHKRFKDSQYKKRCMVIIIHLPLQFTMISKIAKDPESIALVHPLSGSK